MRFHRVLLLVILTALTVLVSDSVFQSSLQRTLWPLVTMPMEGAILEPPVVVHWEGPKEMRVAVVASGLREDLGRQETPLQITAEHFPRPGQYGVEIHSPILGAWSSVTRRFLVKLPEPEWETPPEPCFDCSREIDDLHKQVSALRDERDRAWMENAKLGEENLRLDTENQILKRGVEDLYDAEELVGALQEDLVNQRDEFRLNHEQLLEENRLLRGQLDSVPPCTAWGYLKYPRPQTIPLTRRFVVVSNNEGRVFQNQLECEITRRADTGAASPCVCVGPTWRH